MSLLKDMTKPEMKRAKESESEKEGNEDRLSNLPDCIILQILSLVNSKDAIQTCVLSRRWEHTWKRLPALILHAESSTDSFFDNLVSKLLSLRDSSVGLHTLDFNRIGVVNVHLLKRVISYAIISHNVKQLGIVAKVDIDQLPPTIFTSIFSCQTLTSLKLSVLHKNSGWRLVFPKSPNLPTLTSLYISNIEFCASDDNQAEPFSTLNKLNNLIMPYGFTLRNTQTLCICSTTLSSLTIRPKPGCFYKIVLSTPNLCSFDFEGVPCHGLSGSSLSTLKQVNIDADISHHYLDAPLALLNLLKELVNVQSLSVTVNTLQVLLLIPDLLKIKLPSLGNLKSLKVKMHPLSYDVTVSLGPFQSLKARNMIKLSPTIPDGILDFLLQNSGSAKVVIIKW